MAEIKDKVITVESLKALHDYNSITYMNKENPIGTGSLSMNRKSGTTIGMNSVALGRDTTASGLFSHAVGETTTASGTYSHAEGVSTIASGKAAHAEGQDTTASYDGAHAEGQGTIASGKTAHAEGEGSIASKPYSHAEGAYTLASSACQHVQGQYNIEDTSGVYAHIVGNGTQSARSNAHTLDWDGNAWYAGDITAEGNMILTANQYGDELPAAGTKGRIFFKKLSE